ncbi:MAG: FIST N-terminal domain-containing protein [Verrucomicrobiota bacterium]
MPVIAKNSTVQHFASLSFASELEIWTRAERERFNQPVTFASCFISPQFAAQAPEILEIIRIYGQTNSVVGCTSNALVTENREIENEAGFIVTLYFLPETEADCFYISSSQLNDESDTPFELGSIKDEIPDYNAWLLFASPQNVEGEAWLKQWDLATEGAVTVGGYASAQNQNDPFLIFHRGKVHEEGAVAVGLKGRVTIEPIISQGCRPVGTPWPVTQATMNVIHKIGNRPILEVLRDTLEGMSQDDQSMARGNIFIGLVLDEYKPKFETGDFLVRNLAAIDPKSGAVAIATAPRVGQNLQFQIRDAHTASVGFEKRLEAKRTQIGDRTIYGGCLVDCIGRGTSLYGVPDHDIRTIQSIFPGLPVSGLFCNGEFGRAKGLTRLHGYAACLGLFVDRD